MLHYPEPLATSYQRVAKAGGGGGDAYSCGAKTALTFSIFYVKNARI